MVGMYFFVSVDWDSFIEYYNEKLRSYVISIAEGTPLSSEQIDEIRLLIADTIAFSDLPEDEKIVRDYRVRELMGLIYRNYKLTGEIPEFVSKYHNKDKSRD
jgi:hypothetical protein